ALWTSGKVGWSPVNDWLLGATLLVFSTTRCHTNFVVVTRDVGLMKYVYFLEGIAFVGVAILMVSRFGFPGLFISAIGCDILFSGIYGTLRTARFAGINAWEVVKWLSSPFRFLVCFAILAWPVWLLTGRYSPPVRFALNAGMVVSCGGVLFWFVGLSHKLQIEVRSILKKILKKTGLAGKLKL
ncbi:MAG: hypothetical protein WCH43_10855, partial [Verrucomicrobiota bacterium]